MRYFATCFLFFVLFVNTSVSQIVADNPHVKLLLPGWCGSGTIAGNEAQSCLISTNGHVTGTEIGREITIDLISNGRTVRHRGRLIAVFYRSGTNIDFAVVRAEGLTGKTVLPINTSEPTNASGAVTGSPRCVWPLTTVAWRFVRLSGSIMYGTPAAIGGQSGSGVIDDGQQIGIVTWTDNRHSIAQTGRGIWNAIGGGSLDRIPANFRQMSKDPERSTPPPMEDCFRWQTNSDVRDLPIWSHNQGPTPEDPKSCFEITAAERDLIEFIRSQTNQAKSVDWLRLIKCLAESLR